VAIKYLNQLRSLFQKVELAELDNIKLEFKHFFSGAAVYANGKICMTLTPAGFAIKLSKKHLDLLLKTEGTKKLQYFPNAPVKKEYVVLSDNTLNDIKSLHGWVKTSIKYAVEHP